MPRIPPAARLALALAATLGLLTGCPDRKLPKDPPLVPTPKAAPAAPPPD